MCVLSTEDCGIGHIIDDLRESAGWFCLQVCEESCVVAQKSLSELWRCFNSSILHIIYYLKDDIVYNNTLFKEYCYTDVTGPHCIAF